MKARKITDRRHVYCGCRGAGQICGREAVACALESIKEGVTREKLSRQELWEQSVTIIRNARESTALLMKHGLIQPPPPEERFSP